MSARTPSVGERSAMDDIAKAPERSPSVASHRSSSTQSGSTSSSSCASSSEEPGSNDENDDEKEPVSDFHAIELQDEVADQKTLEARFTDKQLKYLESRRNEYRYASAAQRREIAAATGKMFAKKVQDKRTERAKKKREAGNVNLSEDASKAVDLSKDDIKAIHDNVKRWYAQRARTRNGPMHWTINWTARQVFYKENTDLVLETQKALYKIDNGHSATEAVVPVDVEEVEDEKEDGEAFTIQGNGKRLFDYFQRAVTAEWNRLTGEQKAGYEKKAQEWREKGPSVEERRRLAEKEAGRVIHQFADEIYRQMGVRMYLLVNLEGTDGRRVVFSLDFNNQIDNGQSFKLNERTYLEKTQLEQHYAAFVESTLPGEGEMVLDQPARKRGTPTAITVNDWGEPIVPDLESWMKQAKGRPNRVLPDLIRSIMRHDFACAQGIQVSNKKSSPPWSDMIKANMWYKYIDRSTWPDTWPRGDPNNFGVDNCTKILTEMRQRQQRGEVPFRFKAYKDGDEWVERVERRKIEEESEYEEEETGGTLSKDKDKRAKGQWRGGRQLDERGVMSGDQKQVKTRRDSSDENEVEAMSDASMEDDLDLGSSRNSPFTSKLVTATQGLTIDSWPAAKEPIDINMDDEEDLDDGRAKGKDSAAKKLEKNQEEMKKAARGGNPAAEGEKGGSKKGTPATVRAEKVAKECKKRKDAKKREKEKEQLEREKEKTEREREKTEMAQREKAERERAERERAEREREKAERKKEKAEKEREREREKAERERVEREKECVEMKNTEEGEKEKPESEKAVRERLEKEKEKVGGRGKAYGAKAKRGRIKRAGQDKDEEENESDKGPFTGSGGTEGSETSLSRVGQSSRPPATSRIPREDRALLETANSSRFYVEPGMPRIRKKNTRYGTE